LSNRHAWMRRVVVGGEGMVGGGGGGGVNIGGDGEHGRMEVVGGRVSKVSGGRGRG
jgi:hypothetical protein